MAEGDIGARGYCRHGLVISRLMQLLGWDKKAAHREFCWAVKVGDLRIKGKPGERPDFPADHYDHEHIYIGPPGGEDIYGRPYEASYQPYTEPFLLEEYSIFDLENLVNRLLMERNGPPEYVKQDEVKNKLGRPSIPLDLLIPQMQRLAAAGELPDTQLRAAKLLENWLREKHPDRYATDDGIRGNRKFLAEHRRLTGSRP